MNVYTAEQVADKLHLHLQTVRRWLRSGELPGSQTPAGWRISETDLEGWLARYRNQPGGRKAAADLIVAQEGSLRTVWDNAEDEVWNDA